MKPSTMSNKQRNFTPSDDALILQQPVTGIGVKTLATTLHTSREMIMRRASELGVSLASSSVTIVRVRSMPRQN